MVRGNRSFFRLTSFLMLLLVLHFTTLDLFATPPPTDNGKDGVLGGRAFDEFKLPKNEAGECKGVVVNSPGKSDEIICQKPLANLDVHIVDAKTGKGLDAVTDKDGCYIFKNVPLGTYSESATFNGKDYTLEPKIQFEAPQKLFACVSLKDATGEMILLHNVSKKDECKCKQFPLLFLLLGGAGGAAVIAGTTGGGGPEASPSNPPR